MENRKYRGLTIDTKKWVYGYYFKMGDKAFIIPLSAWIDRTPHIGLYDFVRIIPETVGQSVGLHDCKGKEGYCDDLVKWGKSIYQIMRDEDEAQTHLIEREGTGVFTSLSMKMLKQCEIIGSIHEELRG